MSSTNNISMKGNVISIRSFNSRPDGEWDRAGRWYPSEEEECSCCKSIRGPSRAWPKSLWKHCKSRQHYKNLCEKLGVKSEDMMPKIERCKLTKAKEMDGYKLVIQPMHTKAKNDIYYSWYMGSSFEWPVGKWIKEAVDLKAHNGLNFFDSIENIEKFAHENNIWPNYQQEVVIFKVKARYFVEYKGDITGKYLASMLKLTEKIGRLDEYGNFQGNSNA